MPTGRSRPARIGGRSVTVGEPDQSTPSSCPRASTADVGQNMPFHQQQAEPSVQLFHLSLRGLRLLPWVGSFREDRSETPYGLAFPVPYHCWVDAVLCGQLCRRQLLMQRSKSNFGLAIRVIPSPFSRYEVRPSQGKPSLTTSPTFGDHLSNMSDACHRCCTATTASAS
jgi:hypothetical protein